MTEAEGAVVGESVVCETKADSPPVEETESEAPTGHEQGTPEAVSEVAVTQDNPDHKRKLEDLMPFENDEAPSKKQQIDGLDYTSQNPAPAEDEVVVASEVAMQEIEGDETGGSGHPEAEKPVPLADVTASGAALVSSVGDVNVDEQQPPHVGEIDGAGLIQPNLEAEPVDNGQISSTENIQQTSMDDRQKPSSLSPHQGVLPHTEQQNFDVSTSRKIEVPNNKVGVLIGKSGDTIRYLQINSGVKIQITRDGDIDPNSSSRLVELIGTLENINKAELLIKDVIAEAIAGGSPSLVARGFSAPQSGGELSEIQIPSQKVGMIIGKGGETIKSLQTKSGARIQLLPQHLPDGDASKERTVRITGSKKQVEYARDLIKDVMNQAPSRSSHLSSTYGQHTYRPPRGPAPVVGQWGPRGANSTHQQRGMYPPQTTQYPQSYAGGYSHQQQPPPRGWEQPRPASAPLQNVSPSGGYGYYNQGGGGGGGGGSAAPNTQQLSNPMPGPTPAPMNYNYNQQTQAPDGYGHQATYAQPPPPAQHNYGQQSAAPYDSQPPQNMYGHQQPGIYGQQPAAPYGKPTYEASPSYGPPRAPQPGDPMYQGAPPPGQYPSMQQPYPYGSSAPTQPAAMYGQAYGPSDGGYSQQTSAGYPQQQVSQPAPGYGQAAAPTYTQPGGGGGGGYSQYPSSQPSYVDQSNMNYGYQGGGAADASGYAGNAANSGYAQPQPQPQPQPQSQPVGSQAGYSQPQTNPSGYYDQQLMGPQSGYGAAVQSTPAGYVKSASPQPGYGGGQYDATTQMYGHH